MCAVSGVKAISNPNALRGVAAPAHVSGVISVGSIQAARTAISAWPGYSSTPLLSLHGLAAATGLGDILYKNEEPRLGLKSFKALGGAYAVYRVVSRFVSQQQGCRSQPSPEELLAGEYRHMTRNLTVTCATDGNHGRSVAWGAQLFGCRCVIFLPQGVSRVRRECIESLGARVEQVAGNYDEAVRAAAQAARAESWIVVSDTSYEGYIDIPTDVMSGYGVMTSEILEAVPKFAGISHVILQGGVGGLAAAVVAHMWQITGAARPTFIVVEPETADCLFKSAVAGKRVVVGGKLETVMGGLACGEPSLVAWEVLRVGVDFFATLPDAPIGPAMRSVAVGVGGDPPLIAGESGVVGVAFLRAIAADTPIRELLQLDARSRVLVFGTEGDTDPVLYRQFVDGAQEHLHGRC